MLKQGFDLRLGQTLSMTPQLQQAIRLLQLSSLELQTEIQQALEENPLLQLADDAGESVPEPSAAPTAEEQAAESRNDETPSSDDSRADQTDIPDELNMDAEWEDIYDTRSSNSDSGGDNSSFLETNKGRNPAYRNTCCGKSA